jgi:hypothetical protein
MKIVIHAFSDRWNSCIASKLCRKWPSHILTNSILIEELVI